MYKTGMIPVFYFNHTCITLIQQTMKEEDKTLLFRFLEILCEQGIDYIRQNFKDHVDIQFFEKQNTANIIKTSFTVWNDHPNHLIVNTDLGLSMCTSSRIAKEDFFKAEDPLDLINDHIMCNCDRLKNLLYQHAKITGTRHVDFERQK